MSGFTCTYTSNITNQPVTTQVISQLFYPQCPKVSMTNCNVNQGAYVAAITVCEYQLWNYAIEAGLATMT